MTTTFTKEPNMDDTSHISKTNSFKSSPSNNITSPVANSITPVTLVENEELTTTDEQLNKVDTSPSSDTPKGSNHFHRTSSECSTSIRLPHTHNNKAILNIGGVRHEGKFLIIIFSFAYINHYT